MRLERPLRLVIVNDYDVVVHGVREMLRPFAERVRVVDLAADEPSNLAADVALYDTFAANLATGPDVNADHLVLYTNNADVGYLSAARALGAHGVIHKAVSRGELVDALERVAGGETVVMAIQDGVVTKGAWPGKDAGLSEREAEIVALIAQGLSNDQIARTAFLSINTVKSYIRIAYRKMGVTSRSKAVLWGVEHGFSKHARRPNPADAL